MTLVLCCNTRPDMKAGVAEKSEPLSESVLEFIST